MKEIKEIIRAYQQARAAGKQAALVTVVHVEGSSYRSPGARMLVTEDGMLTGAISGGCLEGDALRKALLVMMEERPLLVTYDTSDEDAAAWGVALGCNGIIRVLIEPIPPGTAETPVSLLQRAVEKRQYSVIVTCFTPEDKKNPAQGTCLAVTTDGAYHVDGKPAIPYAHMAADIAQVRETKGSVFVRYPDGEGTAVIVFMEYLAPPPALVVAGAGNDVLPLAALAELMGWEVTLVDGRPAYADEARFPSCRIIVSGPSDALDQASIDEDTAVILMSHNYDYDKAVLERAINTPARYIGILGPAKKRERLLAELAIEESTVSSAGRRIFGPMGLDIGAETAEEIALSVMAEIKAVFAGKAGEHLADVGGSIHRRQTRILPSLRVYGIMVLAAGESKRLGTPKQQLTYRGQTLLERSVRGALETGVAATVVVLGAGAETIQEKLEGLPVNKVINVDHQSGIASSIRSGVQWFKAHYPHVENVLIMLCDQPHVDTGHLHKLIQAQQLSGARIVASHYADRKGVPAVFHSSLFPQLLNLKGDTGAKHIIEALEDEVLAVSFPQGAVDVDTEEAYGQILADS